MGEFFISCPNCIEPATSVEHGAHTFICVTSRMYGTKCQVILRCTVCGTVQDVTETDYVRQTAAFFMDDLLKKEK